MSLSVAETSHAMHQRITHCRSCAHGEFDTILDLGDQYLSTFVKARSDLLPRAPLELIRCRGCGLLQLQHSVSRDHLYSEYWYRSGINGTMRDALADVVSDGLKWHEEGKWLDIGANDGTLLKRVPDSFYRVACEPSSTFTGELERLGATVVPDYFSKRALEAKGLSPMFDVITSCACFYDVDDPNSFVADIANCLTYDGVWINQLSHAEGMLESNAFDSICHEHVTYWDLHSLATLYARNGLVISNVSYNDINGGSVRVSARKGRGRTHKFPEITQSQAHEFGARIRRWKAWTNDFLYELTKAKGPIWCLGASTKGSVLMQYLDCSQRFVACADRNPAKRGLVQAGTWLPIVGEEVMRREKPHAALVQIWPFRVELMKREAETIKNGTALIWPLPNVEVTV